MSAILNQHSSDAKSETLVSITNVSKSFGYKFALENVSWSLPSGQVCGLLGPNGAGKTTLFRLLMGILKASSGSLSIRGLDCFEDSVAVKRLVGFLPDEPIFYSYLSGREIIHLSAGMHGLAIEPVMEYLNPLIRQFELSKALDQFADDYSRGMKKKLGILLAILHQPQLLILDEPTNGLDIEATRLFFDLVEKQTEAGKTVVFSTHLLDQVERLCTHTAIIADGQLITSGALNDICQGRSLEEVFIELTHRPSAR